MILIIDNYDSFTYNLVHLIGALGPRVVVHRNDVIKVNEALDLRPAGIVLSPGPCTPAEAGICVDLVRAARSEGLPLLGVCLGHQSIVAAAGGKIIRAKRQMHGRVSEVSHDGKDVFAGLKSPLPVTRYHSLVADEASLPDDIIVGARANDDDEIMGIRWGDTNIFGVQFHPESIASEGGASLIRNFLSYTSTPAIAA